MVAGEKDSAVGSQCFCAVTELRCCGRQSKRTRSRDMGRAYKLSEVLPRVKTPLSGIWGEFDSTTYPHIQERIDLFRALQPDFQMNVIPGAGHWVAYEAADAFNRKLIDVLLQ